MKFKRVLILIFLLLLLSCSKHWATFLNFDITLLTTENETIQDTITYLIACDHFGWILSNETDSSRIFTENTHMYHTYEEYENEKPEFGFYAFIKDSVILDTVLKFEEINFVDNTDGNSEDDSYEYIDTFYVSF